LPGDEESYKTIMGKFKYYFVYMMSNWNNKVLYTGLTNDLLRRTYEHKNKYIKGFTAKYNITKLVYYEVYQDIHIAIFREKEIKKWRREKKNKLIGTINPEWRDLSLEFDDERIKDSSVSGNSRTPRNDNLDFF